MSPNEPNSGRVTRGGGLQGLAWRTRSATRPWDFPATPTNPKGFRVVVDVDAVSRKIQQDASAELSAPTPKAKTSVDVTPASAVAPENG